MTKVLILGGTGFVGRALCREAVRRGWTVTSLSRHGAPKDLDDGLLGNVRWKSGNALDPEIYPSLITSQDYVVHSIGILFESNPLYNLYKSNPIDYQSSYQAVIRDTVEMAAEAAAAAGIKAFGYISTANYGILSSTFLPQYMAMKQEAENVLWKRSEFRTVIIRPGFMYGPDRWLTIPLSLGTSAMTLFTAGLFPRSLSVDTVARAMLNGLTNSSEGAESIIVEAADIPGLAF